MRVKWLGVSALLVGLIGFTSLPAHAQQARSRREYVEFAMRNDGDASRGQALFNDEQRTGCAKCHSVDGSASKAGPDLRAVGDKFPRRELIRAVLEPSAAIAVGYDTTIIETRDGEEVQGIVKQSSDTFVEIKDASGVPIRIDAKSIHNQRTTAVSLMPEGLETGLRTAEFADLVAYLEHLRAPASAATLARGLPTSIPRAVRGVDIKPFFSGSIRFEHPLWFGEVPGTTNRFVVLEHFGRAYLIEREADGDKQQLLMDMRSVVRPGGASGLLALAFHPQFATNRKYYLKYQVPEGGRVVTIVDERQFAADGRHDSGSAPRQLLRIPGSTPDHVGGALAFGPDGYLYIGMGDTGPQRDPQGHGQDLSILLGKILRIDVNQPQGERAYAIPTDNPFRTMPNARPEIWALGFREPWRLSFDRATGDLWVGDVGQDAFEEVAIVRRGENHGWNVFEGFTPFSNQYRREGAEYIPPVLSYSHRFGVSITGGYVYRGRSASSAVGWYICGDFETRRIWALTQTNRVLSEILEIGRAPTRIASFTENTAGELYLVGYDDGVIYSMDLQGLDLRPLEVRTLAATSERAPVSWRYSLNRPPEQWFRSDYEDSAWTVGQGGFGTVGTPGATVRTDWHSGDIWLRREFVLSDDLSLAAFRDFALRLHHDEDAQVYINGVEALRADRWTQGYIELPITTAAAKALRPGRNVIAIHCRQVSGGQYIDAGLIGYLATPVRSAANR